MLLADLLYWVGLVAVAVGAATGVFEAERKGMDLVGTVMVAGAEKGSEGNSTHDITRLEQ